MDPVPFLKCILFFSLDRIIIYWNKLYDLRNLVGLPVWFVGTSMVHYSKALHDHRVPKQLIINKISVLLFTCVPLSF